MRRTATLVIGVVIGVVLWGTALAAIPDAGGVIHGCYKNADLKREVIVIDEGQTCPSGYTALDWNQEGPQGATGATGTPGADGATGATGPQGPALTPTYHRIFSDAITISGRSFRSVEVRCDAGEFVVGGSYQLDSSVDAADAGIFVTAAGSSGMPPGSPPGTYSVNVTATTAPAQPVTLVVSAVCMNFS